MANSRIRTPCIGVCSTVFGDTVCRGCYRFDHEVVQWNGYSEEQKRLVWQRLNQFTCLVVKNYFRVLDADLLASQLDYQNIRYQTQLSPAGWIPPLLKAAGSQRIDYPAFGLQIDEAVAQRTPRQLYDRIRAECHALSQAHHDRSFERPVGSTGNLVRNAAREKGLL